MALLEVAECRVMFGRSSEEVRGGAGNETSSQAGLDEGV
jgi:hypothetical protein